MAYTLRQLIDMIRTVPDARTALQKLNDKVEGLGVGNSGGGGTPIASTDSLPEGSLNLYFTPQRVRNTSLTGLQTSDNSDVTTNDTVLSGIGKLQAKSDGYGDVVTYNIGTSGDKVPVLNGVNSWYEKQTFSGGIDVELAASMVQDGNQSQEVINLYGAKSYDMPTGGYPVNAVVRLDSGDTVKSTAPNNTANPNTDMTDWVKINAASQIFDASGKSQQQINDSIAVKFLKANEIGLTKWADFKKPPYTVQEYEQAYNNGINLTSAIKDAYNSGFDSVVLERGKYPFLYENETGSQYYNLTDGAIELRDMEGMTFDLNCSVLFAIFDSVNRSPYDKSTNPVYSLNGSIIDTKDSRNITVKNGTIRGDQYMRSWVAGEDKVENTVGIMCFENTRNLNFKNLTLTGFRADGISGTPRGYNVVHYTNLQTWYKGGINASGVEVAKTGAYRTSKLDISGKTIIDNFVQLVSVGSTMEFRSHDLLVAFYDSNNVFLGSEQCHPTEDIYLPINTKYLQFVAYDDERTTDTVTYGLYLSIDTGWSSGYLIQECEFYENHRGGISNLGANTLVDNCYFYEIGENKLGFPDYLDPTRYGINFEDTYVSGMKVSNSLFKNIRQGILAGCRNAQIINNRFENIGSSGVTCYATASGIITNNIFDNVGIFFNVTIGDVSKLKKNILFCNNIVANSNAYFTTKGYSRINISYCNNTHYMSSISFVGNGDNLQISGNYFKGAYNPYTNGFHVQGAESLIGNIISSTKSKLPGWKNYSFGAKISSTNSLYIDENSGNRLLEATSLGEIVTTNGVKINSNNYVYVGQLANKSLGWVGHINKFVFNDVIFNYVIMRFAASGGQNFYDQDILMQDCHFENGAYFDFNKGESGSYAASTAKLVFKDCVFNLTNSTKLFNNTTALLAAMTVDFIGCTFVSDTQKSLAFIQGITTNITANATNCKFANVINTDSILQIGGITSVIYDPPSLANGVQQSTTVTLAGAKVGDNINVSFGKPLSGTRMWGEVTSANTVTIYHRNDTGAVIDVESGTLTVKLI